MKMSVVNMFSDFPREIGIENLGKLSEVFKPHQKHIVIYLTIKLFIKRFEKFPELIKRFKLFALTVDWANNGAFMATVSCTDKKIRVLTFSFF